MAKAQKHTQKSARTSGRLLHQPILQPLRPCEMASDYMCLQPWVPGRCPQRSDYIMDSAEILCCSIMVSLLGHIFFLLPSGLFAQNYYHVVSYKALAIKLY